MKKLSFLLTIFTILAFNKSAFADDSCATNHTKAMKAIQEAVTHLENHKEAFAKSGELLKKLKANPNDPMAKEWQKELQENNKITSPESLNPMPSINAGFVSCKNDIAKRDELRQKMTELTNKMNQATGLQIHVRFH
jgi:hypothetical protein